MLKSLKSRLLTVLAISTRAPRTVVVIWGLALLLLASQIPGTRMALSVSEILDDSFRSVENTHQLSQLFGDKTTAFLMVAPNDQGRALGPEELSRLEGWVEQQRANNNDIAQLITGFDIRRQSMTPLGLLETPLLRPEGKKGLERLNTSPWGGILTDDHARDLGIVIKFRDAEPGQRYGAFNPVAFAALLESLEREVLHHSNLQVYTSGTAAFQHYSLLGIQKFQRLNFVMLLGLILALRLITGTWLSGLLLVGLLGAAGIVIYGVMGALKLPVDLLSTGLFLMISVAAISDFLFISGRQRSTPGHWLSHFRRFLLPSFLTSLTTFIGFASLYVSDMQTVQRFGLLAALGAVIEWLLLFSLLPAVLSLRPSWRNWCRPRKIAGGSFLKGLEERQMPRWVVLVLLLAFPMAMQGVFNLNVSDSLARLFPADHPYHRSFDYLDESRRWQGEISLLFPATTGAEEREAIVESLGQDPNIYRVLSADKALRYLFRGAMEATALLQIRDTSPELGQLVRNHYAPSGEVRYSLYLNSIDLHALRPTLGRIETACARAGCVAAGDLVIFAEYSSVLPKALLHSFATCLALVALLILVLCMITNKWRSAPAIVAATFWGPAVMLSIFSLAGLEITFLSCVFASVLVGLTGDNFIQYLFADRKYSLQRGFALRGVVSLQVAFLMATMCLVFLGSSFMPSRVLGTMLAIGLIVSVVGDLWMLKALVSISGKKEALSERA